MSLDERRQSLRELLDRRGLAAVRLRRPENFAWYTGGGDNRVDHAGELGAAEVVVTAHGDYVLTTDIEAQRMRDEETPGFEVAGHPWWEEPERLLVELTGGGRVGADTGASGELDVAAEIAPLRHCLDAEAIDRLRKVCADAGAALDAAAAQLDSAMDEAAAAAALSEACRRACLFTPVLLVGGQERLSRYRHPLPKAAGLGARCLLVLCAERGGLYANVSRIVHFEPPDADLVRRIEACREVLARMREATTVGRTLAEIFEECRRFYAEAAFPDEWRLHHQGGLTGYRSREVIAGPGVELRVRTHQAFAWNPSVTGAKAEETFLLGEDGAEVLVG